MAIQWRYGDRSDLSIEKLLIAESAVEQDTEEAFLGFGGGSYKKLILLDENGSLDLDIMPVGTTWIWWNDTLPSDKWVFGNTSIPTNCTKAIHALEKRAAQCFGGCGHKALPATHGYIPINNSFIKARSKSFTFCLF